VLLDGAFAYSAVNQVENPRSRNLTDARRLNDGRPALALGKTRSFIFVGVHAAEFFPVRVVHGDEPMVMLPAPILAESTFFFTRRFLDRYFCHSDFPVLEGSLRHYGR
jgi:hypothetical protein